MRLFAPTAARIAPPAGAAPRGRMLRPRRILLLTVFLAAGLTAPVLVDAALDPPTTTLQVAPNISIFGESIRLTANVTASAQPIDATIRFLDAGISELDIVELDDDTKIAILDAFLTVGTHTLTAEFKDGPNGTLVKSTSLPVKHIVLPQPTRAVLSASPGPSTIGQSVALTATVGVIPFARIAAGGDHTCALLDGGAVKCWGSDQYGQIGDGGAMANKSTPTQVSGLDGTPGKVATAISAGNSHTCALLQGGAVVCWGANWSGQIGNGGPIDSDAFEPTPVAGIGGLNQPKAIAIAAGDSHTCAVIEGGAVKCWGWDTNGQLGNGSASSDDETAPVDVLGFGGVNQPKVAAIAAGESHTCALIEGGAVKCWGSDGQGQVGNGDGMMSLDTHAPGGDIVLGGIAKAIATGRNHTCALIDGGGAKCWGANAFGQLGDGNWGTGKDAPVQVEALGTATSIAAGGSHTCALVADGAAKCWGRDVSGELGNDIDFYDFYTPASVADLQGATVIAVTAGYTHTCALLQGGSAMCWGSDGFGQLGDGGVISGIDKQPTPVPVFRPTPTGGTVTFKVGATPHGSAPLTNGVATLAKALPPGQHTLTATFVDPAGNFALSTGSLKHLVTGTAAADTLRGTSLGDVLMGMAGNDAIFGLAGNDTLSGGDGADTIEGGKGKDAITGGTGNDTFVFRLVADSPARTPDIITDFRSGDRIDLSRFDGNTKKKKLQRFTSWAPTGSFSRKPGELRFVRKGGKLEGDVNGDGRADFRVILKGVTKLPKKAVKLR